MTFANLATLDLMMSDIFIIKRIAPQMVNVQFLSLKTGQLDGD